MKSEINPSHVKKRSVLRKVGPIVLLIGISLTLTAFIDFVIAAKRHGEPDLFWLAFIGMPLMFVGVVTSSMAYMGTAQRYIAGEMAPVAKDTLNYMADGTKEGMQTVATALATGMKAGISGEAPARIRCHKCNETNDSSARFCKSCGTGLNKSKPCSHCNELNDPDAKFCDDCGKAFTPPDVRQS